MRKACWRGSHVAPASTPRRDTLNSASQLVRCSRARAEHRDLHGDAPIAISIAREARERELQAQRVEASSGYIAGVVMNSRRPARGAVTVIAPAHSPKRRPKPA